MESSYEHEIDYSDPLDDGPSEDTCICLNLATTECLVDKCEYCGVFGTDSCEDIEETPQMKSMAAMIEEQRG